MIITQSQQGIIQFNNQFVSDCIFLIFFDEPFKSQLL